jgi:hypothetical protein
MITRKRLYFFPKCCALILAPHIKKLDIFTYISVHILDRCGLCKA